MKNSILISAVLPSHQFDCLENNWIFFYSYQRTVDDERHYLFVFHVLFVILGRSISIHIHCPNFLTNKRVGGKDNVVICQPVKIYCSDIRVIRVGNWVFEIKQVYGHVYTCASYWLLYSSSCTRKCIFMWMYLHSLSSFKFYINTSMMCLNCSQINSI